MRTVTRGVAAFVAAVVFLQGTGSGEYTMSRPNTKIYRTQCTGTGNRDEGVGVRFKLVRKSNMQLLGEGTYGGSGAGWMVSLYFADKNVPLGAEVDAYLITLDSNGADVAEVVHKVVETAVSED